MKINHIAYLVDNINISATEFKRLGFTAISDCYEDFERGIYILFLDNNGYVIELIQPTSDNSSVSGILKRYRNSPYHICYETENLADKIAELTSVPNREYILIRKPEPSPAMRNCPDVAFLMSRHIGMVELVEYAE